MGEAKELLRELAQTIVDTLEKKQSVKYHDGSVPIEVATRVLGRKASWIRAGIIAGWLPIGVATRDGEKVTDVNDMNSKQGRINYFISPKLFYEYTGYLWEGEKA